MSLDLGVVASEDAGVGSENNPVPVTAERAGILLDCIDTCFDRIGLDAACGGDTVFRDLVRARIIHPGSKLESIETLADVGVTSASYRTIARRLPEYATDGFREIITQALATHAGIGPGSFLLYDVTTLYFETDTPDDLRKPGFSKERRVEPQILVGLLTDSSGFPLTVGAFEGNKAETHTMLPMIRRMQEAYKLSGVTIVADAGMFSAANKKAIVDSGLHYILSVKTPNLPEVITEWKKDNPGTDYEHGQVWRQPSFTDGRKSGAPDSVTFYHYSRDRARRTLRGINEQLDKAKRAVAGETSIKRNKYVDLKAPNKKVNYALAKKHTDLAGIKGYETDLVTMPAEDVITYYRRLINVERSFRMKKSDLKARPIYHRTEDSINAHITIVTAALAVAHEMVEYSGMSLKKLVRTLRRYRSFELEVNGQTIHATVPLPDNIQTLVNNILHPPTTH